MRTRNPFSIIESPDFKHGILFICVWIFLRLFFEGILEASHRIGFSNFSYRTLVMFFIHFPLFYLSLLLLLIIYIKLLTQEDIKKITNVSSIGLGLIILVPIIDWIIGKGYLITYPLRLKSYVLNFLNPTISLTQIGVSPGQRIVIVIISILLGLYVYSKTRNLIKSILAGFVSLLIIIFWGGLTTLISGNRPEKFYIPGGILYTDTQKFAGIYAILFLITLFIYLYYYNEIYFGLLIRSIRLRGMFLSGGLGLFGFLLAILQKGAEYRPNPLNPLGIIIIFLSLSFGFWTAQIINDLYDTEVDQNTQPRNPLLSGLPRRTYQKSGFILAVLAGVFGLLINFASFLIILTIILLSIVYSAPPVRLKRIPIISTFILAGAVILSVAIGYSVCYGNRVLNSLPPKLLIPTLVGVTFASSAKDIQNIVGDEKNNVITLPILLYQKSSLGRFIFALFVCLGYLSYLIFIPQVLPGAIICSIITILYTLSIKNPKEWVYFLLLFFYALYLGVEIIMNIKKILPQTIL